MDTFSSYTTIFLVVLLLTSFVKIVTTLNILSFGIGLKGSGIGLGLLVTAFVISVFTAYPQIEKIGGLKGLFLHVDIDQVTATFTPFLKKHSDPMLVKRLIDISNKVQTKPVIKNDDKSLVSEKSFVIYVTAFLISQLKEAFYIGFIILIPFLVIDLLVVHVLMLLSVTQLSQQTVAIPLKLLLFVAVDGWSLITQQMLENYMH